MAWTSLLTVHRRAGDAQYFPLVSALARLNIGDPSVYEAHGSGVASFPFAPLLGHAVFVAIFGRFGWLIADVAVAIAHLLLGRWLLVRVGVPSRWALLASLTALFACLQDWFSPFHAVGVPIGMFPSVSVATPLSPLRFPRPYVTELFVLLALGALLQLCVPPRGRTRDRRWDAVLAGAAVAGLAQADIYAAAGILPWFACFTLVRLVWEGREPGGGRPARQLALLLAGTACVLMIPFALQRLFEQPDMARRLGMHRVDRASFALPPQTLRELGVGLLATVAVTCPLVLLRKRAVAGPGTPLRRALLSLGALFFVAAGSALAKPLFVLLTGVMLQPYHFETQFHRNFGVAATCLLVWLGHLLLSTAGRAVRSRLTPSPRAAARMRLILTLVWTLGVAGLVVKKAVDGLRAPLDAWHTRSDFFHYGELGKTYTRDLRALIAELHKRRQAGLEVLGTLDHELMVWWVVFGRGFALNPDPFTTTIPDAEIERRLFAFAHAVQIKPAELAKFLVQDSSKEKNNKLGHNNIINNFFLGHQKYGGATQWYLKIPKDELVRLRSDYEEWEKRPGAYRLDGLVLFSHGSLAYLTPDPSRFTLAYENRTFRLYVRQR